MASKPSIFDMKYQNMNTEETMLNYERDMMLWEQTEALKESNEIMKQKLKNQEENNRMYEQAMNEIKDSYEATAELNYKQQMELEEKHQSQEELMRYYNLCDDIGLNYDEIKKLNYWLKNSTNEQWDKYVDIERKYEEIFETDELKLLYEEKEKLNDEYKIIKEECDKDTEEMKSKWESLLYKSPDELYAEAFIEVPGLENLSGGTEDELKDLINENTRIIKTLKSFLFFMICVIIPLCFTGIYLIAIGFGVFLGLIILDRIVKLKNGKKLMEKAINEKQMKIKEIDDKRYDRAKKCDDLAEELEKLDNQILNLEKAREEQLKDNKKYISIKRDRDIMYECVVKRTETLNEKEFNEFRSQHYNEDVERLFRKIGLNNIKRIKSNDVKNYGQIEDYRKFIEDKVLDIDDLFFEDYEEYYMQGVYKRLSKFVE